MSDDEPKGQGFHIDEVARWFNVPSHLIASCKPAAFYSALLLERSRRLEAEDHDDNYGENDGDDSSE